MGVRCGLPAWIDEAEQREGGSLTRRRRCKQGVKVSTWKGRRKEGEMWLLVRGRGGEVDISAEDENLESLQPKNWRAKCHQTRSLIQNYVRYVDITNDSDSLTRV